MLGWAKEGELGKDTIKFLFPLRLGLLLLSSLASLVALTRLLAVRGESVFQAFRGRKRHKEIRAGEGGQGSYPFFKLKSQGLFKDFQKHISHFPRTPFSAKKSLESFYSSFTT